MAKVLDLDATENKVCKQYRKDIFKKISHLPFSEKRNVLQNLFDMSFSTKILNRVGKEGL